MDDNQLEEVHENHRRYAERLKEAEEMEFLTSGDKFLYCMGVLTDEQRRDD